MRQTRVKQPLTLYLQRLVDLVDKCDPEVACWSEDGTCYIVKNSKRWNEEVLKKHFKSSSSTFIRQLHFYGFRKLDADENGNWGFSHSKFRRGMLDMVHEIRRKTRPKKENSPEEESLESEVDELKAQMSKAIAEIQALKHEVETMREEFSVGLATLGTGHNLSRSHFGSSSSIDLSGQVVSYASPEELQCGDLASDRHIPPAPPPLDKEIGSSNCNGQNVSSEMSRKRGGSNILTSVSVDRSKVVRRI